MKEYLPSYATSGSAGLDLRGMYRGTGRAGTRRNTTGSDRPGHSYCRSGICRSHSARSGLGHKHGIVLGNLVGLIDSDYQGQLMISTWNGEPNRSRSIRWKDWPNWSSSRFCRSNSISSMNSKQAHEEPAVSAVLEKSDLR